MSSPASCLARVLPRPRLASPASCLARVLPYYAALLLMLALICSPAYAQYPGLANTWVPIPCYYNGVSINNPVSSNGYYTMYETLTGTAINGTETNTYPKDMIDAAYSPGNPGNAWYLTAASPLQKVTPQTFFTPGQNGVYWVPPTYPAPYCPIIRACNFATSDYGSLTGFYNVPGDTLGTFRSGPINGSVTTNFSGTLEYFFKWVWNGSGAPTTPRPDHMMLLVKTSVAADAQVLYGTSHLTSGLTATATASDSFGETAGPVTAASPTDGPAHNGIVSARAGGMHPVRALVNSFGVAGVSFKGGAVCFADNPISYGTRTGSYTTVTNGPTEARPTAGVTASVTFSPEAPLNGLCINKDLPFNVTWTALPVPTILYGGSVPSTSDELRLNAADPNPIPGTTYTWSTFGPALYPVPASNTPLWNVGPLQPRPAIQTFACLVQPPGTVLPTTKLLDVEIGIRTDDVLMVGWINGNGVPISSVGVNPAILTDMPLGGGPPINPAAAARIAALVQNNDCVDYAAVAPWHLYTVVDKNYILDWMFKYAPNPDPQSVLANLATPDITDPTGYNTTPDFTTYAGYMDYPKLQGYLQDSHRFKLLNHFQVKYRVNLTNPTQFNGSPIILQRGALIGATVNPTGIPPNLGPIFDILSNSDLSQWLLGFGGLGPAFLLASWTNHTFNDPQAGPANGIIGPTPAVTRISQINDGSPEIPAIRAFNTLLGLDMPTPLFWQNIGSKITFNCGATAPVLKAENYPTYYSYWNGRLILPVFFQSRTPNGHFFTNPYPFGTVNSYGLPPRDDLDLPLMPGLSFPTVHGGRDGIASTLADPTSSNPAYIFP